MRFLIYSYSMILGVLKMLVYKIAFGKGLKFTSFPHLDYSASLRLRKDASLHIGKGAVIGKNALIAISSNAKMQIGSNSVIGFNNIITCRERILIGNNVSFGPGITMFDHDHDFRSGLNYNEGEYNTSAIIIEDNVWLGSNVTILKGVRVGKGSVVAAGSIVTKDIPAGSLYRNKLTSIVHTIES